MECPRIITPHKNRAKAAKKIGFEIEEIKKRKIGGKRQKTFYLVRKLH
ncbi:MAG: hypothetical protein AB1467_01685 [Candidatus Diapherotrites archaeon]